MKWKTKNQTKSEEPTRLNQKAQKLQKTQKTQKTRKITFRLSESEYEQISDNLSMCGLTVSSFTRKRLLGIRIASQADIAVLAELRRLGGLLKHIHNETRGEYSLLTAQAIQDLSSYVCALTEKSRTVSPEDNAP